MRRRCATSRRSSTRRSGRGSWPLIEAADRAGAPAVVVEAIKLVEGGLAALCDEIWLVTCDPETQRARLAGRGMAAADAERRIAAQGDLVERLRPHATRAAGDGLGAPSEAEARTAGSWPRRWPDGPSRRGEPAGDERRPGDDARDGRPGCGGPGQTAARPTSAGRAAREARRVSGAGEPDAGTGGRGRVTRRLRGGRRRWRRREGEGLAGMTLPPRGYVSGIGRS